MSDKKTGKDNGSSATSAMWKSSFPKGKDPRGADRKTPADRK
ncbi:hypothetical protein [Actinomadura soli]|nr:hypothetical protein [Actinomadura soli]